jgi:hypothetical protein
MVVIININSMRSSFQAMAAVCCFLGSAGAQPLPKFMGRQVTILEPKHLDDFPLGPASVCLEGPLRQCYTAPQGFGNNPTVAIVQLQKDVPAILFSAETGGNSGSEIHFALLRPGTGKDLEDLFAADASVSNQSQHAFWTDSEVSPAPIFLTAEYVYGPGEGHYGAHRYVVSSYVLGSSMADQRLYYLQDRYMTVRKYDLDAKADVLASEKPTTLSRLRRVKAAR